MINEIVVNSVVQLGAVGILVAVLVWLVIRYEKRAEQIHNNHRDEREGWRNQQAQHHKDFLDVAKNSNTILAEIKTILQLK